MKNMFKYTMVVFVAVFMILAAGTCHCDDSSQNIKTFKGQVQEVDWVGSLVTVNGGDEMTFYVPPGTVIRDGTGTVSLSELEQDDTVLIKYVDNPTGTPKVVSMSLNKSYPEF